MCNENYYISADYDHLTTAEYKKFSESDCIMGVELWIGEEFEHGHEMEALAAFLKNMVHSYTSEPTRFCVLANFMVNYSPIDLAVVKNNGLAVIELKQVGGPVFGGENGDWIIREGNKQKVLRGGSKGNPYNQVITYRISFLKFLDSHRSKFLQPRVGLEPRFDHVNGIVALAPTIPKGSEIDLPEVPWLKVVGLDELHREIFLTRSSRLALTSKEITRLLENVLRLRKDDIAKYMETTNRTVVPPVQVKPETLEKPIPAIEAPLTVVKPEKPHIEDVTSEAPDQAPCPVCSMGLPECALRSLSGRIEGITRSGESQYVFRIITDDFEPWAIPVHSCWNDYATRLKSWLDTNQSVPVKILHLEKEGDTLQIGQDSLLVIEPDWLINVTDMTKVEFCQRQLLLDRFISSPSNEHMIRGNLVHQLFPDIWHSKRGEELEERRRELLQEQVEDFITTQSLPDDIKPKCDHAIEHLTQWVDQRHRSTILRTETFVLSPSLGTKGKIDFLWEDLEKGRIVGVGELKTGQSQGGNPKPGDALQLLSYTMMLFSRGEITFNDVYALLLYSGNTILGDRGSNLSHRLIPKFESIKRAVNIRNDLVLMELTGQAQFESNMNKCRGCRQMSTHCARIALLSNEEDTRPVETTTWLHSDSRIPSEKESAFFLHYSRLIAGELRALKEMHAELWRKTPEQREAQGEAFRAASFRLESQQKGRYQYSLEGSNSSEFRAGDSVLISDCKGPSSGRVSLGIVQDTSKDALLISASEEIRFEPVWVDPYTNENLTIRLFKGLYRWISRPSQMSDLILGNLSPDFGSMPLADKSFLEVLKKEGLNDFQSKALQSSICARSYCVVHGPPGSGKTKLISAIVRAHLLLNQRVLMCTGTNRALDEAMRPLTRGALRDKSLRIGNLASVTDTYVRSIALQHLIKDYPTIDAKISAGRQALVNRSVVGITASSLQSGRYDRVLGEFDLVVIDEAAQLTVPATLGCISFAKRFVLIGDHNQLPAVVQSEGIGSEVLDHDSGQWSRLSKSLFEILYERCEKNAGREVIFLKDQYRMNDHICSIPGTIWYKRVLRPATKQVGDARLIINEAGIGGLARRLLDPNESVQFVNVPLDNTAGPRTNLKEAQIVCDIIEALATGGFSLGRKDAVAIICPRRAQVELIRRHLEGLFRDKRLCEGDTERTMLDSVSTVDRFQGSQSDVVIVSLGMSDSSVSPHLADEKRLNVAMSRARHKLILLGNREALSQEDIFGNLFQTMSTELPYSDWYIEAG